MHTLNFALVIVNLFGDNKSHLTVALVHRLLPSPKTLSSHTATDYKCSGENGVVLNGAAVPAAPKLGPKANQGAINACLRALDRTGKPCRKWAKSGFKVKSFTGVAWDARAWTAHKKAMADFAGDVKSDSSSSGENKPTQESSAVASEKSVSGADASTPLQLADVTSSPAPFIAVNPV
jgi:hypothetical protein